MFLMNAPPVLALQSTWEAFGPLGSCRFPGCCSEATEGVGGTAVSASVHMIISTLQGARAAQGMSHERTLHGSQRAERGHDDRWGTSPTSAACGLAADFDPKGDEQAADVGPSLLDSDSDDSVDRDIEEAIQEYLKAKSGATQPPAAANGDNRCKPEPPKSSTPTALCPPKLAAGSGGVPGSCMGASKDQGSASPVSVSSEDSFEQSIRAEIEQFLSEKRQHETPKCDVSVDETPDPNDSLARPALRSSTEPIKVHRQDLTGVHKEFVFRKPPRLAKATAQPRGLRSKVTTEPESVGSTKPVAPRPAAACRPAEAAQNKGGVKKGVSPGRRGQRLRSAALVREASDSSSDDGIEEAIQLYQLEKRKEASADPPQKTSPGEEQGPDLPAHGSSHSTKSALPETNRKMPGKKRPVASKTMDLGPGGLDPEHPSKPPKETKAPAPPGNTAAKSECVDRASCRADTPTELMCAEAILDISKTALPAPGEGGDGPLSTSLLLRSPNAPSRSDGDSSAVDSDDSIEQEIRTFLALKAQSGTLLARTETCPPYAQSPVPSPGPNGQAGGPKAPSSKTQAPSLSSKRKRRGGSSTVRLPTPKKAREAVKEGALDADHSQGRTQPGRGRAGEAPGREGEARGQPLPCRTVGLSDEDMAPDARGGVSPGQGKAVEARSVDEKESSEDKSSSLDSDEDLDTAIKDLLRSKRQLKRRCRDPRAAGKKKVRFSTTEAQFLDQLGGFQRDWKDRSPHLLKSCLSKSKKDSRENPLRKPSRVFGSQTESTKLGGAGPLDVPPAFWSGPGVCEGHLFSSEAKRRGLRGLAASSSSRSDDSSSVDSDDSIELEIRKFLAEKAKESVSGPEIPGGGPTRLGPGNVPRPELLCRKVVAPALALQPGMCTRSQRGRGTPQPAVGLRAGPHAAQACLPAALARGQLVPPRSASGTVSARGSPTGKRNLYSHKDQSPRGAGPATGDRAFGQLSSCAEAGARAGSPGGALPMSSRRRSTLTRSPGTDREGGPQAGLTLPWGDFARQSQLQSTWVLSSEGRDTVWKGGLGGEREKGPEGQAPCAPSLPPDPKRALPFAGFSPLLSTQLFHFGKSVSWGAKPAGLFSTPLSLPLQGPSFSAFREPPASRGPVLGSSHLLMKKEGGHWPSRRASAALSLHDRRNSGSEEAILDLRYRRSMMETDHDDPEAWGSDASELSDTSMEEGGGGPVAKGKVLKL
ncbi:PREDICTED: protein phosphatase 1 regulatory subunit 26 [Hipposideros armiger]|uniref:Protein phosphatase 1 regulatory subunit 26 n=1 Tax=Hipposideros armiger TaxID=186990 RepID=A0A8B7R2W3_HIPAR|nr:PREDICTED: protein phosphatase 1 regulatory subunit 26 [Hipposideros armiger]XP_019495324.1 PREDICTED: protein phosphatase 1 regulatory subunit 26 [Hipposideros armiger]XP_019495334.1 PREDICTED: protein phosphatase 1 regulatory subunit 26 [Hipposideros armiger]XP_019495343.1 PREDICTED: protein phosphatase 1 regulatory subunit 26 [Hipposideros armiger]XP_019495352.1 PREDICTED: protein phosphatase 1 regulatory subunit 26 [Hipposideros armiger]XP_019495362.1 PREDICTED: protein phosphatase 1 re